jgi:hypothetical protein
MLVGIPGPPDIGLDSSWQLMLIHAKAAGLQYGTDLVFTWGPWGFLCSPRTMGGVEAVPILVWQTAGQLLVAASLVALSWRLPAWRRLLSAAFLLAFHWLFADVEYYSLVTLAVVSGIMRREARPAAIAAWTLLIGFVSLFKFTYFALAGAGILAAMGCWGARGSWARAWGIGAAYLLSVLAAWVAAGQHLENLFAYVRGSLALATGYVNAMGVPAPGAALAWASCVALLCVAFLWGAWRAIPERAYAWAACGFVAFAFFAMWKEAFVRADLAPLGGHVFGWFILVLVLAPLLPALLVPGRRFVLFDLAPALCLAAFAGFDPGFYRAAPTIVWQRLYWTSLNLQRLGQLPRISQEWYDAAAARAALPRIQAAVAGHSVDVYDFDTGGAFLNGLRVQSRPVFQGYSAYTPALARMNLRHFQGPGAPEFLLWDGDQIDNRAPGQDDALVVAALPGRFEPAFREGRFWLLRRTSPVPAGERRHDVLLRRRVAMGEEVVIAAGIGHAVWLRAQVLPTLAGRLRALAYKPGELQLVTTDDTGRESTWRLIPGMAATGLFLVPALRTGEDAAALLRGETAVWIRSFRLAEPQGQAGCWKGAEIEVSSMPEIPLALARPHA